MPTYAFVDKIDPSPTVLFNLDNQSPFSVVVGTQTPPPTKRYSSSGSTARDGDTISQSSYNDRIITIALRVELAATAEEQTEGIQALGRLLDAEQWLMWQHDTMIEPVFFRTRRGDLSIDDNMMVDKPKRTLTLTIPAEPFAYGAAVTGTATIANDPTAATNPMSYVFPDVQGDVKTPLYVDLTQTICQKTVMTTTAVKTGSWPAVPFYIDSSSMGTSSGGSPPWSTQSDALMIGGSALRLATSATGYAGYTEAIGALPSLPRGDYRVFARLRGSASGRSWTLTGMDVYGMGASTYVTHAASGTPYAEWFEMGIARLPASAPVADNAFGISTAAAPLEFRMLISANQATASTLDVDAWLFLPINLDSAIGQVYTEVGGRNNGNHLVIDGINSRVFGILGGYAGADNPLILAGGMPQLVPGATNVMNLLRDVYDTSSADPTGGAKASTSILSYKYFPRYLYIRPATT